MDYRAAGRPIYTGPDYDEVPPHTEPEPAAFETTQIKLVRDLRTLADENQERAARFAERINDSIARQGYIAPHVIQFMARSARVAHVAARTALTIERYHGHSYAAHAEDLLCVIEEMADGNGALNRFAAERVRLAVRQSIDASHEAAFAASSGHQD